MQIPPTYRAGLFLTSAALLLGAFDGDALDHDIFLRTILRPAGHAGDLVDHVLSLHDFAEDRVLSSEPSGRRDGNEKLRAVGIRTRVRHGKLAGFREVVRRALGFVFKLIAGSPHAVSGRITTLNH